MKRGVFLSVAGLAALAALAGCGRSFLQTGERAAWRSQAESACMQSGAVKVGVAITQMESIDGPGICGATYPLKVAALGTSSALGYSEDLRPPGAIPRSGSAQMPRWPGSAPVSTASMPPAQTVDGQTLRWVVGPPGAQPQSAAPPAPQQPVGQPMSLSPPPASPPPNYGRANLPPPLPAAPATQPAYRAPQAEPEAEADDVPDDVVLPQRGRAPAKTVYNAPIVPPQPQQRAVPPLGPMRGPATTGAITPAALTPPATLSCPIVSALERWVTDGVQPAALHWFGVPVAEIKQISAYSCRGMVGAGSSHISEHAFGNALDVAGFVLADGRKIMVQHGWRGTPEEQGFLHDVQLYACQTFNTVLAPGYNAAHYNHIHVDLMRRSSGRRPCRPDAIPGEVVAAKARAVYASKQRGPSYTGSIAKPGKSVPQDAIPGEDGLFDDEAIIDAFANSPLNKAASAKTANAEDDTTGSIGWPRLAPRAARPSAPTPDRFGVVY